MPPAAATTTAATATNAAVVMPPDEMISYGGDASGCWVRARLRQRSLAASAASAVYGVRVRPAVDSRRRRRRRRRRRVAAVCRRVRRGKRAVVVAGPSVIAHLGPRWLLRHRACVGSRACGQSQQPHGGGRACEVPPEAGHGGHLRFGRVASTRPGAAQRHTREVPGGVVGSAMYAARGDTGPRWSVVLGHGAPLEAQSRLDWGSSAIAALVAASVDGSARHRAQDSSPCERHAWDAKSPSILARTPLEAAATMAAVSMSMVSAGAGGDGAGAASIAAGCCCATAAGIPPRRITATRRRPNRR